MTNEDAQKVAAVVAKVDGGCVVCVSGAIEGLVESFPQHDWPVLVVDAGWDNYGRGPDSALAELRRRRLDYAL